MPEIGEKLRPENTVADIAHIGMRKPSGRQRRIADRPRRTPVALEFAQKIAHRRPVDRRMVELAPQIEFPEIRGEPAHRTHHAPAGIAEFAEIRHGSAHPRRFVVAIAFRQNLAEQKSRPQHPPRQPQPATAAEVVEFGLPARPCLQPPGDRRRPPVLGQPPQSIADRPDLLQHRRQKPGIGQFAIFTPGIEIRLELHHHTVGIDPRQNQVAEMTAVPGKRQFARLHRIADHPGLPEISGQLLRQFELCRRQFSRRGVARCGELQPEGRQNEL
ncbi:hypothetical protein SDC9_136629 [bioreactor metagenome]|uniref:Uncharacterized protein n=1 Tax=bioreactor metagenome TaxID=1076179 RepID=A0A645DJ87_9ZZZZ